MIAMVYMTLSKELLDKYAIKQKDGSLMITDERDAWEDEGVKEPRPILMEAIEEGYPCFVSKRGEVLITSHLFTFEDDDPNKECHELGQISLGAYVDDEFYVDVLEHGAKRMNRLKTFLEATKEPSAPRCVCGHLATDHHLGENGDGCCLMHDCECENYGVK